MKTTWSDEQLKELREYFRRDMKEHYYCIGEDCVEEFFRKLLSEPEPQQVRTEPRPTVNAAQLIAVEIEKLTPHVSSLFERDDTFYKNLNK